MREPRRTPGVVVMTAAGLLALLAPTLSSAPVRASTSRASMSARAEGRSAWSGVYTAAQAARGEEAFRACTYCHGRDLKGGDDPPGPALRGEIFLMRWRERSVGDLYVRIAETMPKNNPGGLTLQGYADVMSYLLQANGLPAGMSELPADPEALGQIGLAPATGAR